MKLSRWILLGGICYVLFAVAQLPASVAANWLMPDSATASGISGTAWNGQASSVTTDAIALYDVRWSLKSWKLLILTASAEVNAKVAGGAVRSQIDTSLFGGVLTASDLRGVVKMNQFSQILQLPLPLGGDAGLTFSELTIENGTLTTAFGEIQLVDITEPTANTQLGNFSVNFGTLDSGATQGLITDTEALFELDGKLLLNPDRSYSLNATIKPTNTTPATIGTAAGMLGASRDAAGNYTLSQQGSY